MDSQYQIVFDDEQYQAVARIVTGHVLISMVKSLRKLGVVSSPPAPSTKVEEDLLFELAFFTLANFESYEPILLGGRKWLPLVLFQPVDETTPPMLLKGQRTALHGNVDDELLREALIVKCP